MAMSRSKEEMRGEMNDFAMAALKRNQASKQAATATEPLFLDP